MFEVIVMRCMLSKDINNCPFYNSEEALCTNENSSCSFRVTDDKGQSIIKNHYVRKPRWYEKYYK